MFRRALFLAATLTVVISGCSTTPVVDGIKKSETPTTDQHRQMLLGRWLGEAPTKDGGKHSWVMERKGDGTYQVDFQRLDPHGKVFTQSEFGVWGISGGIYFTAMRGFIEGKTAYPADTSDASLYDTYQIISLTKDLFEYESLSTKDHFIARRIGATEGLPPTNH